VFTHPFLAMMETRAQWTHAELLDACTHLWHLLHATTTMYAQQTRATLHLDVFTLLAQPARATTTIPARQTLAIPPLDAFILRFPVAPCARHPLAT